MKSFSLSMFALGCTTIALMHNPIGYAANTINMPQVFLNAGGDVISLWEHVEQNIRQIRFTKKSAQGSWSPVVILSDPTIDSYNPVCSINPNGDAAILWLGVNQTLGLSALYGTLAPAGSEWSQAVQLSNENDQVDPGTFNLHISHEGNISAIWEAHTLADGTRSLYSAFATPTDTWSTPVPILR